MRVETFKDITLVMVYGKAEVDGMKPFEQSVNFCKWMKNPRVSDVITIFQRFYQDLIDPGLLQCTVKKGKYIFMKARVPTSGAKDYKGFADLHQHSSC